MILFCSYQNQIQLTRRGRKVSITIIQLLSSNDAFIFVLFFPPTKFLPFLFFRAHTNFFRPDDQHTCTLIILVLRSLSDASGCILEQQHLSRFYVFIKHRSFFIKFFYLNSSLWCKEPKWPKQLKLKAT